MRDIYIFDLDGTLADIQDRRDYSSTPEGKIDWDKFFDPKNIDMDKPNHAVIETAKRPPQDWQHYIYIFSRRGKVQRKPLSSGWTSTFEGMVGKLGASC